MFFPSVPLVSFPCTYVLLFKFLHRTIFHYGHHHNHRYCGYICPSQTASHILKIVSTPLFPHFNHYLTPNSVISPGQSIPTLASANFDSSTCPFLVAPPPLSAQERRRLTPTC